MLKIDSFIRCNVIRSFNQLIHMFNLLKKNILQIILYLVLSMIYNKFIAKNIFLSSEFNS